MSRGRFITFEGGEGAGKSTQAALLSERLRQRGLEVVQTREPGGSPGAEALRGLVVEGAADRWSPMAETLIMFAARADHVQRVIRPAMERGAWVVCDRFTDSSRAYQGVGGGVAAEIIDNLDLWVVGPDQPDLTFIFDLPVEVGLARAAGRGGAEARFESKGAAFHQALRDAFRQIAADHPERCVLIDAAVSVDVVADQVWATVERRLA
jgi:dTMP kinase